MCTDTEGRNVSVLPMDANGIRGYAVDEFYMKPAIKQTEPQNDELNENFYSRLGATPAERDWLVAKGKITMTQQPEDGTLGSDYIHPQPKKHD